MQTNTFGRDALRQSMLYHKINSDSIDQILDTAGEIGRFLEENEKLTAEKTALELFVKCEKDVVAFSKQVTISHVSLGRILFEPYPHQELFLRALTNRNSVLCHSARQMGTSSAMFIYILWYALFHADKTILYLGPNFSYAKDSLVRIAEMLDDLPEAIRPSFTFRFSAAEIVFENGSRILARTCNLDAVRGMTIDLCVLDQVRFMSDSKANDMIMTLMPCLAAGSKFIAISSGDRVGGFFHQIWTNPWQGAVCLELHWSLHPDRDAEWETKTRAMMGDKAFDVEFGLKFGAP